MDANQNFGITACPECDRLIWWFTPPEAETPPLLSADFQHELLHGLGADSLKAVDLVMSFEAEFSSGIPDEDAEGLKSLEDVVAYIETHREKRK